MELANSRGGTMEVGMTTLVPQGPDPYVSRTVAVSHCESSVEGSWKLSGISAVAFQEPLVEIELVVPSENVI